MVGGGSRRTRGGEPASPPLGRPVQRLWDEGMLGGTARLQEVRSPGTGTGRS